MACLDSKCEYSEGARNPTRAATSRRVSAARPCSRATCHAASRIFRRAVARRSEIHRLVVSPNIVRPVWCPIGVGVKGQDELQFPLEQGEHLMSDPVPARRPG